MYLENLVIKNRSGIVRKVVFKKGLNLIIDETSSKSTDSGNNVGKTTFLRIIDYCLGGKKDAIYTEKEFNRINKKLLDYLKANDFVFELSLISKRGSKHTLTRPIEGKSYIDNELITSEPNYADGVKRILFNANPGRPTLGQLMNKFIRIEDYQISNALYFLHNMADNTEYESLFLFLFGFRDTDLLAKKRRFVDKVKKLSKKIDDSEYSLESLEQQLYIIEKDIVELEKQKNEFNFVKDVTEELSALKILQTQINALRGLTAKLSLKFEMNRNAVKQLAGSRANIDTNAIQNIYKQANVELPNLSIKFDEVLKFHNKMLENKIKYIETSNKVIELDLNKSRQDLNSKVSEEAVILKSMQNKGALDLYDKVNVKLNEKSREKGNKEGLIQVLSNLSNDLKKAYADLSEVNSEVEFFEKQFNENLKVFNSFFSGYSKLLYGDQYYLTIDKEKNKTTVNYLLDIGNMNENIGTGKKKAQISALDLAYLKYAETSTDTLPLFVVHDQLESVFENQIDSLFEMSKILSGQFIVAVLSDKLHNIDKEKVDENKILTLSQNDKLLKMP